VVFAAGALTAYTYTLIGRCCELTGTDTLREAWAKALGKRSAWMVSLVVLVNVGVGCLTFSMVLADDMSLLFLGIGAPAPLATRSGALVAVTVCVLLPLCFLESCDALKYTSFAGSCGSLYTVAAMAVRLLQGAYAPGGELRLLIPPHSRPSLSVNGGSFWSIRTLVLVSDLVGTFNGHYNAPKLYRELERRSLPRFSLATGLGFAGAATIGMWAMVCGFLTFGGASAGLILNNYAATDSLVAVARMGITFAMICTYPLEFGCLRESVLEAAREPGAAPPSGELMRCTTLSLLALITGTALVLKDFGVVVAVEGAVISSSLVFVVPALIFLGATKGGAPARSLQLERLANHGLVALCAVFAVIGTATTFMCLGAKGGS